MLMLQAEMIISSPDPCAPIRIQLRNFPKEEAAIEKIRKAIHDAAEEFGDDALTLGSPMRFFSEDDQRVEIPVEVNKPTLIGDEIVSFCSEFVRCAHNRLDAIGDHKTSFTIAAFNSSVFPKRFLLDHRACVKTVMLGNFISMSNFLPHRDILANPKCLPILHKFLEKEVEGPFHIEFTHDNSQAMLQFAVSVVNDVRRHNVYENMVITMYLRYKSFRRIVVSFDDSGNLMMFINLRHPPKLTSSIEQKNSERKFEFRPPIRVLTWGSRTMRTRLLNDIAENLTIYLKFSKLETSFISDLLGRINKFSDVPIEFRTVKVEELFRSKDYVRLFHKEEVVDRYRLGEEEHFGIYYCLNALVSRGGVVKDLILRSVEERDRFLKTVFDIYNANKEEAIDLMEQLVSAIDEMKIIYDLTDLLQQIRVYGRVTAQTQRQRHDNWQSQGYMRVRKVIITPTRRLFVVPELMMGNRVLRKVGTEVMLRVLFRDDDGSRLNGIGGSKIIENCVKRTLMNGMTVAGRNYVMIGSSNSQLRDNGCYFIQGTVEDAVRVRRSMGKFKIEPIPKMMARIGQCFTQSKLSQNRIDRQNYKKVPDYIGGRNSKNESYCFSDGVGAISQSFAGQISKDLHYRGASPSCFQFRFRGFKGVLCVNPILDKYNEWALKNDIPYNSRDLQLRPSQEKFRAPREEHIEIVKHSAPSCVSLNKPMINILDQVSSMQSISSHRRIVQHVQGLLNRHLNKIMGSLTNERQAMLTMSEFPKLIMYERLTEFSITQEPFMRSMLRAWAKSMLLKLSSKMRIAIPATLGRTMFGVVDETGVLQFGQVFIRYTVDVLDKLPPPDADRRVHVGKVLITKNPAVVSGDVRIFEAVDVPAFRHLSDVLVFPRYGPRPHPDEMAGSDLDGDEYTVIWDSELFLDKNEPAFDYSGTTLTNEFSTTSVADVGEEFQELISDFFVKYIHQDSIGRISNAHLANSDLYGLNSLHCHNIAIKHNQSVDFPKTGVPPEKLRHTWNMKADIPPEVVTHWPDFMGKTQALGYVSSSLLGDIYRSIQGIETILKVTEPTASIEKDPAYEFHDDEFEAEAAKHLDFVSEQHGLYCAQIQSLLDTYGITTEGELFSGFFNIVKGRNSDSGDNDDVSLFSMANIVQQRIEEVFASFRTAFFEHFSTGMSYLEYNPSSRNVHHSAAVLAQYCRGPTFEMQATANLYYVMAYDSEKNGVSRFLSFPWLVWDVLAVIKHNYVVRNNIRIPFDPLGDRLTDYIAGVLHCDNSVIEEQTKAVFQLINEASTECWKYVKAYCDFHNGLTDLLVFSVLWAQHHNIPIEPGSLCMLIIASSNGTFNPDIDDFLPWLEPDYVVFHPSSPKVNLHDRIGGLGRRFVTLMSCLANNKMRSTAVLPIATSKILCYFDREKLMAIREPALKTFYQISFTGRTQSLPHVCQKTATENLADVEGDPIIIELPHANLDQCFKRLEQRAKKFGCSYLTYRPLNLHAKTLSCRVALVAVGKVQQIRSFYDSLRVTPRKFGTNYDRYCDMANQVYRSLMKPTNAK